MNIDSQPKLKMLIVDDEPDNLDLLYRTFRLDFQVLRAESAPAALELLDRQGEVAIIISDQRMPEMLGTEFLSRTVEKFPDTIRIVLTAYTDVKDLVDAINSGKVFKYITKPWNQQQLHAVVKQAAETYQIVKQRTENLQRALRRESIFNTVTTAIRESLDYASMLQTIVKAIGQSFQASCGLLHPVEADQILPQHVHYLDLSRTDQTPETLLETMRVEMFPTMLNALEEGQTQVESVLQADSQTTQYLALPCRYQNDLLAILALGRSGEQSPWSQEEVNLIEGVVEQAAMAISQAKLYQRTQQQAEQMRAELAVACQIQNNLLRQTMPEHDRLRVQACCHPARQVGGDFFEVYVHPHGDVWLAVGDVSGKGVPAALFMASAISVLRREVSQEISPHPHDVMRNLNQTMMDDLVSTNCFITMLLARYNPVTRELLYANAGHLYPMVWSTAGPIPIAPEYLEDRGIPLGILPLWRGQPGQREMQSGEIFLLTSDGVTEASIRVPVAVGAGRGSQTGTGTGGTAELVQLQQSGLWELLKSEKQEFDLKRLLENIRQNTVAQEDDQTMLSLEVL
jgi:serine phosphatase RsbU (regulator of sigma subunit)/FixJ family two-component response regulator